MSKVFPHVSLPQVCPDCIRQLLDAAEAHPEQLIQSVYCGHHSTLLTGYIGETGDGVRAVGAWNVLGSVSPELAVQMLTDAARKEGFVPIINREGETVN